MRKIEVEMIKAIQAFKSKGLGNTKVVCNIRADGVEVVSVYLYDSLIAQRGATGWGFNICGWNTPTTRSRINAILTSFSMGRVSSKDGQPYFTSGAHKRPIELNGWQFCA